MDKCIISGAPGTGKTACLKYELDQIDRAEVKVIFINCMNLLNAKEIYGKIALELDKNYDGVQPQKFVEAKLASKKASSKKVLLILDEVDQLASKDQEILYSIFEWPQKCSPRLALVGIANALDLTDRTLPRLAMSAQHCPKQLSFSAYNKKEIQEIIKSRLGDDGSNVIHPAAVMYLASKVSAISGDIRKALDVCRRAIELAEVERRKQTILSPGSTPKDPINQIGIKQVSVIFEQVYSSRVTASMDQTGEHLPTEQKILLASLLLMVNHGKKKCKEVTVGKLTQTNKNVCKNRNHPTLDDSAVFNLCELLETRGLLTVKKKKGKLIRDNLVSLRIDEKEVESALKDKVLLSGIIQDVGAIAK